MEELITEFFAALFKKVASVLAWVLKFVQALITAAWDFIKDVICWPIDEFMKIIVELITDIDLGPLTSYSSSWGSLPAELVNVLGLLGIGTAATIITAAIVVRLGLQLIPFVRLGS